MKQEKASVIARNPTSLVIEADSNRVLEARKDEERIDSLLAIKAIKEFQEGIHQLDSQKYISAISHFQKAKPTILKSKRFNAIDKGLISLKLGNAFFGRGDIDSALLSYQESIRYDFSQAESFNNAGFVYLLRNESDKAIQYYLEALRLNPNYKTASENLKIAKEISASKFSLESYALGLEGESSENLKDRIEFFTRALTLSPNFSEAENALAIAYYQSDELLKSKEVLRRLISKDSSFAEAFNNLGFLEFKLGNFSAAESLFIKASLLKPDFITAFLNLGICYLEEKKYDDALKLAALILKKASDNPLALSIQRDAQLGLSQKKRSARK